MTESETYNRCLALLSRREYSKSELRYKMQQNGADETIIENVLKRLIEDNYQSDVRFAEIFTRSRVSRQVGAKRIAFELKQKGIDANHAHAEITKYNDELLENAQNLIMRKAPLGEVSAIFTDLKLKDKITRSLVTKGYDFDMIRLAFEALKHCDE